MGKKLGHPKIVWVNLREDLVVECGGATYSVREKEKLSEPINMSGVAAQHIEVSINESINQSINQSISQSINQSINHHVRTSLCLYLFYSLFIKCCSIHNL